MKRNRIERLFAISLITMIMFWTLFPMVGYAFLEPGTAITPGDAIAPGEAISGGKFIVPGEVYDSGKANKPGESIDSNQTWNSGQPIIENQQLTGGVFIIPNAPPYAPTVQFSGNGITGGDLGNGSVGQGTVTGGNSSTSPGLTTGNTGMNGTTAGGNNLAGGSVLIGDLLIEGNSSSGGNTVNVGINNQSGYGNGTVGNSSFRNGNNSLTGDLLLNESNANKGNSLFLQNPTSKSSSENSGESNESSPLSPIFKTADGSRGLVGRVNGAIEDTRTYVLGFGDQISQAAVSTYAGFNFKKKPDGKYAVYGKNHLDNKMANWFYDRYRSYNYDGSDVKLGPNSRRIGNGRYTSFLTSKNLMSSSGSIKDFVVSGVKTSFNESWNFTSKDYWKVGNVAKLNGPINMITSSVGPVYDHYDKSKDYGGLASTDFAADLTTEVGIGIATTALGSAASSIAVGAAAGSVVPVVGTLIGAVVGLGVGFLANGLLNTTTGRRFKKKTTELIKNGYDGIVSYGKRSWEVNKTLYKIGKGMAKSAGEKISSTFSKLGKLF